MARARYRSGTKTLMEDVDKRYESKTLMTRAHRENAVATSHDKERRFLRQKKDK